MTTQAPLVLWFLASVSLVVACAVAAFALVYRPHRRHRGLEWFQIFRMPDPPPMVPMDMGPVPGRKNYAMLPTPVAGVTERFEIAKKLDPHALPAHPTSQAQGSLYYQQMFPPLASVTMMNQQNAGAPMPGSQMPGTLVLGDPIPGPGMPTYSAPAPALVTKPEGVLPIPRAPPPPRPRAQDEGPSLADQEQARQMNHQMREECPVA
jgi:hypothetical protein